MANTKPGVACRLRNPNQPFTIVENTMFDDPQLSLEAKGLCGIFKRWATFTAPDFVCSKTFLLKKSYCSEKRFERIWKELKEAGYIKMYWDGFSWTAELLQLPEPDTPHTYYCSANGTISRTVGGKGTETDNTTPENEDVPEEFDSLPASAEPTEPHTLTVFPANQKKNDVENSGNEPEQAKIPEMFGETEENSVIPNINGDKTSPPQKGGDCPQEEILGENQSPPFQWGLKEWGLEWGGPYYNNKHSNINTLNNNQSILANSEKTELRNVTEKIDAMDSIIYKAKKQIDYDALYGNYLQYKQREKISTLNAIVHCMAEVYACTADTIRIGGQEMATASVQHQFHTLDQMHIDYVILSFSKTKQQVLNIPAYLKTALYRAPLTIDAYYDKMAAAN